MPFQVLFLSFCFFRSTIENSNQTPNMDAQDSQDAQEPPHPQDPID